MSEPAPIWTPRSRSQALAERFGMAPEDVERLLEETHREYAGEVLPPVSSIGTSPVEEAAAKLPSAENESVPPATTGARPLSGGFIAGLFTVLLIALGIALSFREGCFRQRHAREAQKPVDTIQSLLNRATTQASTPRPPTNVAPGEVPPEALVVPREEPPGTSGPASSRGITSESEALKADHLPTLETPSNFEAEERLAELRANGNSHAHMKAVRRGHGT